MDYLSIGVENNLEEFKINLKPLTRGLIIIGQSGCGKSFLLGRIIEELSLVTTKSRILIIDPNSDFKHGMRTITLNKFKGLLNKFKDGVDSEAFKEFKTREIESFYEFRLSCSNSPGIIYGLSGSDYQDHRFDLSWQDVPIKKGEFISGKPISGDYFTTIFAVEEIINARGLKGTLKDWKEVTNNFLLDPEYARSVRIEMELGSSDLIIPKVNPSTLSELFKDLAFLQMHRVFSEDEVCVGLDRHMFKSIAERITLIDFAGINDNRISRAISQYILGNLFEQHRKLAEREEYKRTFVIVDEVQSLVPELSTDPRSESLGDLLHSIAAEGRKYGVHLIMITQRPREVRAGLLGECDNAIIMKMNSREDLRFLSQEIRVLDPSLLETALHFQGTGYGIAIGEMTRMAPYARVFRSAPRRTKEGGKDISVY